MTAKVPMNGDRHGDQRDQRGPQLAQEEEHHQADQDKGLDQLFEITPHCRGDENGVSKKTV